MDALFPAEPAARRSSVWVRGPVWDGVWMLNALWLLPLAIWLSHGYSNPESSPLDLLYLGLTAFFWIGHRFCSAWLAYCTEAYRPLLRNEPVRFVVLPLLVTGACFAVMLPADRTFPWSREERVVGMAILDYALVTYHFAAQHFGALSIYRLRAERAGCAYTRRLDRIFALGVGGALVFLADILAGSVAYQDLWIDRWLLPAWLASNQGAVREAAILLLLVATVLMLTAEARAPTRSLPRALYISGLAAMGGYRFSASAPIPLPCDLDFTALDLRDGSCFPSSLRRANSTTWHCPTRFSRAERPALGDPARSRSLVSAPAAFL